MITIKIENEHNTLNKRISIILLTVFLMVVFISACGSSSDKNVDADNNKEKVADEENNDYESNKDNVDDTEKSNKKTNDKSKSGNSDNEASDENSKQDENTREDTGDDEESDALGEFSSEEIEYARVWLQIVGNTDTEELNVWHSSAGEQVNIYDDDSVDYPEDVISLGGKIMADGEVTYSGNGDGSINLYDVPSHWPNHKQIDISMGEYTKEIIKNTKLIYIEPGDDEEVISLIEKLDIRS